MPSEEAASAVLSSEESLVASSANGLSVPTSVLDARWPLWLPKTANILILLLTDMLALLIAISLGYVLWVGPMLHQSPSTYMNLAPLLWVFPLGYAGAGLYPGFGVGAVEILRRLSYCTSFGFLVMAAASFVLKLPGIYSRMAFSLAWATSLISLPLLRFLVLSVVSRWQWWREPAVLVGSRLWVQQTVPLLDDALSLGYRPVGVLSCDLRQHGRDVAGVPTLGGLEQAPLLVERGVRVAIIAESEERDSVVSRLQEHFHRVVVVNEYSDLPVEPVQVRNLGGVFGLEFTNNLLQSRNRFMKRALDVMLGAIFFCFALPIIALGGLLVKLSSRGPIFFCQQREGLGGRPIRVWKLRTMYQDAEQRHEKFLAANPEARLEWERHFKLAHDPRVISGVGAFLRRFSLDELPQVLSVIEGKMSFVGPRPFPEYHLRKLPSEFCELRRRVRPGLTGLWQVMVRSDGGLEEQKRYDTYYIRNWSLWLDAYILARTVMAVLTGRGAR